MNIIKQSISFIVLALSLLISACGGPDTGLSLVGDDNNSGGNPSPPIVDLLSNPKPPAPVIIITEATTSSVLLKWTDESPREFGFLIIRDGVKVGETDKNISQWTDLSVLPATTYAYLIVAWNKEGEGVSQEKLVTTPPLPAPPKWILPEGADIRSLAVDQTTGEVYAAGRTATAPTDAFLSKFNPDGTQVWFKQWGTAKCDDVANLIIFNSEVFLSWSGDDQYCIGSGTARVSRFDTAGNEIYAFQSPNSKINTIDGVAIYFKTGAKTDYQGVVLSWQSFPLWVNIMITDASMRDGITYYVGQSQLAADPTKIAESFTAATDSATGNVIWTSRWIAPRSDFPSYSIAINISGIYTFTNDFMVLHYDFSGNLLWTHQYDAITQGTDCSYIVTDDAAIYAMGSNIWNGCGLTKITNDGAVAWQTSVTGQSLSLFNDVLFVADGTNIILRYDALTGSALP